MSGSRAIDLQSFVKLTGGKGLHVVLPITGADWETAKSFAQTVALAMTADDPKRYVAKITKSLRTGKIFVDYLRNSLEQTAVAAYSTRARAGAPVSVPVTRSLREETKFHQMWRGPSMVAPPTRTTRASVAAVTVRLSPGRKTRSCPDAKRSPAISISPETM